MGECFLYGQGGSGSKKIQGWVTQKVSATITANVGSTPVLVSSYEMAGEIATIRLLTSTSGYGFFYDYTGGYCLFYASQLANITQAVLGDDEVLIGVLKNTPDTGTGEGWLYVKKNGKNLEVYQTNTSSESVTATVQVVVGYL